MNQHTSVTTLKIMSVDYKQKVNIVRLKPKIKPKHMLFTIYNKYKVM